VKVTCSNRAAIIIDPICVDRNQTCVVQTHETSTNESAVIVTSDTFYAGVSAQYSENILIFDFIYRVIKKSLCT
jgi:hypothetical protein